MSKIDTNSTEIDEINETGLSTSSVQQSWQSSVLEQELYHLVKRKADNPMTLQMYNRNTFCGI